MNRKKYVATLVVFLIFMILVNICLTSCASSTEESLEPTSVENFDFTFIEGKTYYCHPKFGGNDKYLVEFSETNEDSVTITYYSHDLQLYGIDSYDNGTSVETVNYDYENQCYCFDFMGHWRVYSDHLEYLRYEKNRADNEKFEEVNPVNPMDYWWYEEAQQQAAYEAIADNSEPDKNDDVDNTNSPIPLEELPITASNGYDIEESKADPRDEVNTNVVVLEYFVEFYTGKLFSKFTATIDPTDYFDTSKYAGTQLIIKGDEKIIYESPTITYKTDDLEIELDVENVDYLSFELEYVGGEEFSDYYDADDILICNAYLHE